MSVRRLRPRNASTASRYSRALYVMTSRVIPYLEVKAAPDLSSTAVTANLLTEAAVVALDWLTGVDVIALDWLTGVDVVSSDWLTESGAVGCPRSCRVRFVSFSN